MSAQDLEQRASAQELRERITIILGSARKRIDGAALHHGEQWVIGGRTAINFIKQKLHRLLSSVEQPAPVVDDARMARALEWVRDAAEGDAGCREHLPAIEEAIAAYDPSCGARTVRVVDDANGWKTVPEEPTREMIDAGVMFGTSPNKACMIFQSMLNAAPSVTVVDDAMVERASSDAATVLQEKAGPLEQETPRRLFAAIARAQGVQS